MINKTIIIIGASGGVGSVLARVFTENGACVSLSARTESKLETLRESLGNAQTLIAAADATRGNDVQDVFKKTVEHFGAVDAVVIAAGTWHQLTIDAPPEEAISLAKKHFDALFLPSFVVGYIAAQFMRTQGYGLIVNISSHASIRPELSGNLTYGPMKAASRHFMLALRNELSDTSVRVTDIQPAIVNTAELSSLVPSEEERKKAVQPEEIAHWILDHIDDPEIPPEKLFDSRIVL